MAINAYILSSISPKGKIKQKDNSMNCWDVSRCNGLFGLFF